MKHFRWILSCIDDNTAYELANDPIGFDDCVFKMERHAIYKGIFNQFTSNLKFHNNGGGKQFIDLIYATYDINGRINIEVLVDSDGNGLTYETLFNGRLNLASYQNDGLHTICNIEQSEIATKLNTRANIPVPLNVPLIGSGINTFKAVFMAAYVASDNNGVVTGTFIFNDPSIIKGKIFKVLTTDISNTEVVDTLTFTTNGQQGNGASSGLTSIQISNSGEGFLEVSFVSIEGDILLYQAGPQLSLGQQIITPIATKQLTLAGIPLMYESESRMRGDINSGTTQTETPAKFSDSRIAPGHTLTVYGTDINGMQISDEVYYTGTPVTGPGSRSGPTAIQITSVTAGVLDVTFANIYGNIKLWIDGIYIDTCIPVSNAAEQLFNFPIPSPLTSFPKKKLEGFLNFDTDTIFDNFNEIVFGQYTDAPLITISSSWGLVDTELPPIFETVSSPEVKYPIALAVDIQLAGLLSNIYTNDSTNEMDRYFEGHFGLIYGKEITTGTFVNLQNFPQVYYPNATTFTLPISVNYQDTLELQPGDKIWFFFYFSNQFDSIDSGTLNLDLNFAFSNSRLDFQIIQEAEPTTVPTVQIHEAFTQVVDMIADTDNNMYSDFYGRTDSAKRTYPADGEGSNRVINNGLCLRGRQDKLISTSFNDLFTSMTAIDNIGMEIDSLNRVRIEKLEHFFDRNTKIATLPKVYSFTTLNENSLYYNQVEVGYDKWETEIFFKGGLDEIHSKRFFGTRIATAKGSNLLNYGSEIKSLIAISNKLEKVSKLIAGNYAIELTRRKNFEWSTDDFKYDNDNFIICVTRSYHILIQFFPGHTIQLSGVNYGFRLGDAITISGTVSNNGTYIIDSEPAYSTLFTTFTVAQTVTAEFILCTITNNSNILPERAFDILDSIYSNSRADKTNWLNMAITPARMLQNNFNHLSACLQKIRGNVQFLNGEGNYTARTRFNNTRAAQQQDYNSFELAENASLSYGDGNVRNVEPLWIPEIYRFEYPLTYQQFKAIRANANGYIEFYKFPGQVKKGFILSLEYNLKTGLTKFELLKMYDPNILLQESEDARVIADEDGMIIETIPLKY